MIDTDWNLDVEDAPADLDRPSYRNVTTALASLIRASERAERRLDAISAQLATLTARNGVTPQAVPVQVEPTNGQALGSKHNAGYSSQHEADTLAAIRQDAGRLCRAIAADAGIEVKTLYHQLRESPRFAKLRQSLAATWTCEPCPAPEVQTHLVHCVPMLRRLAVKDPGSNVTRYTRIANGAPLSILRPAS